MKFILGKKIGMTQVFLDNGAVVPVTRVVAGPCQVTQVKNESKNGIKALQIGFGEVRSVKLKKPAEGHLKGLNPVRWLKDFSVDSVENINKGDLITTETFVVGDKVEVVGVSKGKGFAGVVKRHHFKGGPASHGHKDNLRAPGSIGAGGVQRVFKGIRMAGRMGGDQVTVKNLEVVKIDAENNEIYLKGAVPGARNSMLIIVCPGELKITKESEKHSGAKEGAEETKNVAEDTGSVVSGGAPEVVSEKKETAVEVTAKTK